MELLKIAVVFAATCSVVYTFGTGRDITQYVKRAAMNRKLPILFTRWKSCTELGFHPFKSKDPVPSVSVDMVPAGTRNTSLSVTCYKPGESYDVIISSPGYIRGILIMPLKVGLSKYEDDLVSVGAIRSSPRLDTSLFMGSICSNESVSQKSNFKFKRLTTLTVPWDAPNGTCSVKFIYHVFFTYDVWKLGQTVVYPVCNETSNETMNETRNETTTETMESTGFESNSESESESESGSRSSRSSTYSNSAIPTKKGAQRASSPTPKPPTKRDKREHSKPLLKIPKLLYT